MKKLCIPLALTLCLASACERSDTKARRLHVHAFSVATEAEGLVVDSPSRAHALYSEALADLERILVDCPDSAQAESMARNDLKLGSLTLDSIRKEIIPSLERLVRAENDPHYAAFELAYSLTDRELPFLFEYARALYVKERYADARSLFELALPGLSESTPDQKLEAAVLARCLDRDLNQLSCPPNLSQVGIGTLSWYLAEKGEEAVVALLYQHMGGHASVDILLRLAKDANASAGILSYAEASLCLISDDSRQLNRLAQCAQIWLDMGERSRAERLLMSAYDFVMEDTEESNLHPRSVADLALVCAKVGEVKAAAVLWEVALQGVQFDLSGEEALDSLTVLVQVAAKAGHKEGCKNLLDQLPPLSQIAHCKGMPIEQRKLCLERIEESCQQLGLMERATLVRRHLQTLPKEGGGGPDDLRRSEVLHLIAQLLGLWETDPDQTLVYRALKVLPN